MLYLAYDADNGSHVSLEAPETAAPVHTQSAGVNALVALQNLLTQLEELNDLMVKVHLRNTLSDIELRNPDLR